MWFFNIIMIKYKIILILIILLKYFFSFEISNLILWLFSIYVPSKLQGSRVVYITLLTP
jgi:hypothetical protein